MYSQECGKEFGSLGCHCHGEVLFGSLQVFKSNLFGLCLLSDHVTIAQDFRARVFALPLDISFTGEFQTLEEIDASGIEGLHYHIVSMQSADCAGRKDFPNLCFARQTKRRQKDAKIPDGCFFLSYKTCQSYIVAICCYLLSIR